MKIHPMPPLWVQIIQVAGWVTVMTIIAVGAGALAAGRWVYHWYDEFTGERRSYEYRKLSEKLNSKRDY